MNRLRILHVAPYFERAWAYGGIPRIVATLVREFAAQGHAITVCTTDVCDNRQRLSRPRESVSAGPWTESPTDGVEVRVFPNVSNRLAYDWQLFLPRGLASYLRAHAAQFDVAHLHACRNVPGSVAARELRRAGIPYVLAPNGTAPRIERRRLAKAVFDATLGRQVVSGAAALVAVSDAETRQLRSLGVSEHKIVSVPNPIDVSEFERPIPRGVFRRRLGLGREPLVLFLGKMTPRKRLDVLVRAFARLDWRDARLVLAGNDMGVRATLDTLVGNLAIATRTCFPGLLTGHERLEALADADVVVYPSKDEIFGLVPLEALMSGTPVIVADDSGCGDLISRMSGGQVVPEGEVDPLATAIGRVLDKPAAWREKARAAEAQIRGLFSPVSVCARLAHVYEDVMDRRHVC